MYGTIRISIMTEYMLVAQRTNSFSFYVSGIGWKPFPLRGIASGTPPLDGVKAPVGSSPCKWMMMMISRES